MPNYTPNYNLEKPEENEFYDVAVSNANMDKIDAALTTAGGITLTDEIPADPLPRVADLLGTKRAEDFVLVGDYTQFKGNIEADLAAHKADYLLQIPYAVASGSTNAYAVSTNPPLPALAAGVGIAVKIKAENTGASTLNWNGKGAKPIKKANGKDVNPGNLQLNGVYTLRYDGTSFILQGEGGYNVGDEITPQNVGITSGYARIFAQDIPAQNSMKPTIVTVQPDRQLMNITYSGSASDYSTGYKRYDFNGQQLNARSLGATNYRESYTLTNGNILVVANDMSSLACFSSATGAQLWTRAIGSIRKVVVQDEYIYVYAAPSSMAEFYKLANDGTDVQNKATTQLLFLGLKDNYVYFKDHTNVIYRYSITPFQHISSRNFSTVGSNTIEANAHIVDGYIYLLLNTQSSTYWEVFKFPLDLSDQIWTTLKSYTGSPFLGISIEEDVGALLFRNSAINYTNLTYSLLEMSLDTGNMTTVSNLRLAEMYVPNVYNDVYITKEELEEDTKKLSRISLYRRTLKISN